MSAKFIFQSLLHNVLLIKATTFGMPINDSYIRDQMQKVIDKEGLPDVVFHSRRHTSLKMNVMTETKVHLFSLKMKARKPAR